tara:strand:+ start:181 stop:501 length:321 start_codon:yes stop_codon:yes gene_type:complete
MKKNGIYNCKNENNEVVYVGSSGVTLEKLEWNHRNYYKFPDGRVTYFRKNLIEHGQKWIFEWLVEPIECDKKTIETIEKAFIKIQKTKYNIDKDPVKSSINRGTYK